MARDRLAAMRQAQGQFVAQQQQQAAPQMANYTINQAPGYYERPTLRPASMRSSASTTYTMSSASSTAPSQRRIATSNNATYDELNVFHGFDPAQAPIAPQHSQADSGSHQYNWQPAKPRQAHSRSASNAVPSSPPGYNGSIRSRIAAYEGHGNNDNRDSVYSTGSPQLLSVPQQGQPQQPSTAGRARPGHARRPSSLSSHSYTAEDLDASPAYVQEDAPPAVGIDEMERFFETIGSIQVATKHLNDNVDAVQVLHSRALNTVPESAEYQRISADLEQASEDTRQLSLKLRNQIKELERTNGRAPTPQDANVKRTQTASVKSRFVEAIQRYSQVEAASRAASKQRLGKTYKVINPQATDEEVKAIVEDPDAAEGMFRNAVLHTNRRGEAQATLSAVQARHADIKRIEQTMVELAQLFQDMSIMVEEQDETIVHIEQKAAEAEKDMEIGHGHLVKAKVSAMSARSKRKWCCGIAVILVLALVGGIVGYLVVKNGNFNHGDGGSGNSSDNANSSSSSAVAPADPTSADPATGTNQLSTNQQVDGGQTGQLSQPDDSQGNGNNIVFTPLVQQSAADPTTVTQLVTPSGAEQRAIVVDSETSQESVAAQNVAVNARVQIQSSLEAVVHKTVVAEQQASATAKAAAAAAASVTQKVDNAAANARAKIQSSLAQVVHKTKVAEKTSAGRSAKATSSSSKTVKATSTSELLKPTDIMKSIAKEVHGTELAHRHTANVDKRDVVPSSPSGPVHASAVVSSVKIPQSSALPLTDVKEVMSSIAVEVHGTEVAPRHTAAAVVKRSDDNWILPRAMNFEQRARAWPFVNAEAEADELDAGFEDGGFVL